MAFSPELEFGQRQGITNRQNIVAAVQIVVADNERSRRQVQLDREVKRIPKITKISQEDRQMFLEAAHLDEIPDKDASQETFVEPTLRRVVKPAVKTLDSTLRTQAKVPPTEAKKAVAGARTKLEGLVFESTTMPTRERLNIFNELGRFVSTYLAPEAVYSALRHLKFDLSDAGIPTSVRQEITKSIARPKR